MIREPIKSSEFLPRPRRDEEFFRYSAMMIDYILERYETEYDYIADKYKDYFNFQDIPDYLTKEGAIKQLIDEKGFTPIYEIVNLNTDDLAVTYAYLKLFRVLKGTREGLDVIFKLLGFKDADAYPDDPQIYRITEWWEEIPEEEAQTFKVFIEVPAENFEGNLVADLQKFFRFYVYPLLKRIDLNITFLLHDLGLLQHSYYDRIGEENHGGTLNIIGHGFYDRVAIEVLP
jgi:hypothetical protein